MKPKSQQSKMKQNNSTELLGYSFHKIYNRNDPTQTPQTPNLDFFPDFPDFPQEVWFFKENLYRKFLGTRMNPLNIQLVHQRSRRIFYSGLVAMIRKKKQISCRKCGRIQEKCGCGVQGVWGDIFTVNEEKMARKLPNNYPASFRTSNFSDSFWENPKTSHFHGFRTWWTCP